MTVELTQVTPAPLTADDVKALRQADTVSFHHHPGNGGTIRATKRIRTAGPFDEREREWTIPVRSTFSGRHGPHGEPTADGCPGDATGPRVQPDNSACFEMIHSAQYSETWRTVVDSLKTGDTLRLHWSADGQTNGYVARARVDGHAHLHLDALYLYIERGEGKKRKRLAFLLDVNACTDNSARMVRHTR